MEEYYLAFKKSRVIHAEAQFDVNSFRIAFPDIYQQIGLRDWGPFTIPVDPYFLELVWEFYASYRARQHCLQHKGSSTTWPCLTSVWVRGLEVPVTPEAINSLYWVEPIPSYPIFRMKMDSKAQQFQWGVHINVGELIDDQFKQKANLQATILPFPNLVSMLCLRATCPLFRKLDRTMRANRVITLANKTTEDAQVLKRGKYTESDHSQPTMASSHTSEVPVRITELDTTSHTDLLVLAQKVKAHENHLVKLVKAIPSMIHFAIQRAFQPTRDKLSGLCSIAYVLEKEVVTLRKEISSPSAMPSPSLPSHAMPAMMHDKPDAPRSPPDNWYVLGLDDGKTSKSGRGSALFLSVWDDIGG
ncbi:hypothetical protein HAX54_033499 [Datura stramonium]|uniref:Uncharacterized protein n=1 Tax=Datura stramonium TaxID=4076 RepID=A0ABS8VCH5_DATST|nr:hypothetical protein [Datura stramonium]